MVDLVLRVTNLQEGAVLQLETSEVPGGSIGFEVISITAGNGIGQLTGDVTAGPGTGSQVTTLVNIPLAVFTVLLNSLPTTPSAGPWLNGINVCFGTVTP